MNNNLIFDVIVLLAIVTLAFFCLSLAHNNDKLAHNNDKLSKEAVKRGFAEYNQTNGNWQWKDSLTFTNR